jgi:hypothetical protein
MASLDTPATLPLTRNHLVEVIRYTDGVDVGEIVWEYDGMHGFGFTVVGNEIAAFGRFLQAITRVFDNDRLTQIFVDRVIIGYPFSQGNPTKLVFFPVQLID